MDINKYYTEVISEFKKKLKPNGKIVLACLSPDITMLKQNKVAYYFWVEYDNNDSAVGSFEFDFDYIKANKNLCNLFIFKLARELRNISPSYLTFFNWNIADEKLRSTLQEVLI